MWEIRLRNSKGVVGIALVLCSAIVVQSACSRGEIPSEKNEVVMCKGETIMAQRSGQQLKITASSPLVAPTKLTKLT